MILSIGIVRASHDSCNNAQTPAASILEDEGYAS